MNGIGPKQQGAPAMDYILQGYLAANPDPDRTCYSHFTTATGLLKWTMSMKKGYCSQFILILN